MKGKNFILFFPKNLCTINNNIYLYYHDPRYSIFPHNFCIGHNDRSPLNSFQLYINRIFDNKTCQFYKNELFCIYCIKSYFLRLCKYYCILNKGNQSVYHLFIIPRCKYYSFGNDNSFLFF